VALGVLNGSDPVIAFLFVGNMKDSITKVPPVQRAKSGTGMLFFQLHETEAPAPSRHYVCRQANRSDSAKL
jgi:hypothetical protein